MNISKHRCRGYTAQFSMTALTSTIVRRKTTSASPEVNPSPPWCHLWCRRPPPPSPSSARTAGGAAARAAGRHRTRRRPGSARTSATSARTRASTTRLVCAAYAASCTTVARTRNGAATPAPALPLTGSSDGPA
ncbi:hypothetical protein GE061_007314 [Apolygus lucorum]|uniref:Uncharacterized protein n=1 Tax=Apolygus lucorum TaxID=248454 RepID=A0A6A4J940_APOLU|nr:hypothetical protein GE061_007314 [Apolygus lucorum]